MFDESPKRFDRVIAILIQLQSKKIVKAQELAERFEVSLRTIYRDIRTLEASGVPIYGEAGIGYSLVDGYRLPPVMFTREEASSFIAAEKLMQKFIDKELGQHYQSAMFKLKSVMQSSDKDWVSSIESKVLIQPTMGNLFNENVPNAMSILFKSAADKTQVILDYQAIDADVASERTIEPVGVFHDHNNWYVLGFCHLRNDYRQFRADRIEGIKKTQKEFTQEHETLETYLNKEHEIPTTKVRILVDKKISKYLSSEKKYYGFVSQKNTGDLVEMTFLSRDIVNGFARWFLMFADYAEIIEPLSLNDRILELMDNYRRRLQKSPE
ncbi:YafY family transcriptional regulator [Flavobacterium sp. J49]|uniref:helix-turn-helix transcriptional regulator n=1 Tax=Flavobacterium sp. J49 TaxID=2718534 RepID=UPI001593CF9A|nr:YafY family protein [Flavobacterium sp. J49]MBF6641352.1 YafY family transcriptional regulator [Flavobacterium sp. J49]NIC02599.1 YafY family transcriptional regulator [Flavobacterium sp. J49]